MRDVCDIGGDVDTVACVTGGLAGATFGVYSIPSRWLSHVHGQRRRHACTATGICNDSRCV